MALPKLTDEQRKQALEKAARIRKERAEIKKKLKMGQLKIKDLLNKKDDEVVARMSVKSVIESLPGIGKLRATKIMQELGISETRKIQGLGPNQENALLERFKK